MRVLRVQATVPILSSRCIVLGQDVASLVHTLMRVTHEL